MFDDDFFIRHNMPKAQSAYNEFQMQVLVDNLREVVQKHTELLRRMYDINNKISEV